MKERIKKSMFVIYNKDNQKIPIFNWCSNIEQTALDQAINVSNLPFGFHHVSLMPDAHMGFGCPIGTVFASTKNIVPNLIGFDIGCGVCSWRSLTLISKLSRKTLEEIHRVISSVIPIGFAHHKDPCSESEMPTPYINTLDLPIASQEYQSAQYQLGTLGSGNHFIEIQKTEDGYLNIMLHSGSRNFGYKIAEHYNSVAKEMNAKYFSSIPASFDLAFLPIDSYEAQMYILEMNYALKFAFFNRQKMVFKVMEIIKNLAKKHDNVDVKFVQDGMINIHHNYATQENHYGKNVWVHRKGATLARKGTVGIIPGSQGTASYIVNGLGNEKSFCSCSHGAGRTMGRNQAKKELDLQLEQRRMQGIIHGINSVDKLDEAPSAYKDIDEVMENQKDLVSIIQKMIPVLVVKG